MHHKFLVTPINQMTTYKELYTALIHYYHNADETLFNLKALQMFSDEIIYCIVYIPDDGNINRRKILIARSIECAICKKDCIAGEYSRQILKRINNEIYEIPRYNNYGYSSKDVQYTYCTQYTCYMCFIKNLKYAFDLQINPSDIKIEPCKTLHELLNKKEIMHGLTVYDVQHAYKLHTLVSNNSYKYTDKIFQSYNHYIFWSSFFNKAIDAAENITDAEHLYFVELCNKETYYCSVQISYWIGLDKLFNTNSSYLNYDYLNYH